MGTSLIKDKRRLKNWTQKTLAAEAHVSFNTISNYERGVRCPRLPELKKIASALECSVTDLINV